MLYLRPFAANSPDRERDKEITDHLARADLILLLVSPDFREPQIEESVIEPAMARHQVGQSVVVPIRLRPADWHGAPFAELQPFPKGNQAVSELDQDRAFTDLTGEIRVILERLRPPDAETYEGTVSTPPTSTTQRISELAVIAANEQTLKLADALSLEPRWLALRETSAIIDFWGSCAPSALKGNHPLYPHPFTADLIRFDGEARERRRRAAELLATLEDESGTDFDGPARFRRWRFLCLVQERETDPKARRGLLTTCAESHYQSSGEWEPLFDLLDQGYREEASIPMLLNACRLKSQAGIYDYPHEHGETLLSNAPTVPVIHMSAWAAWKCDDPARCREILECFKDRFPENRLPEDLRRLHVECLRRQGLLDEAIESARVEWEWARSWESLMTLLQVQSQQGDFVGMAASAGALLDFADGDALMEFHPLTGNDLKHQSVELPPDLKPLLTSARAVIDALYADGVIDEQQYRHGLSVLGTTATSGADMPVPPEGHCLLILAELAVPLEEAGLLSAIVARYRVAIPEQMWVEHYRSELTAHAQDSAAAEWLEALLDQVKEGPKAGTYQTLAEGPPWKGSQDHPFLTLLENCGLWDLTSTAKVHASFPSRGLSFNQYPRALPFSPPDPGCHG